MCGIVGYVGRRAAAPLLLEGLRRIEYRGYDSAGVCTVNDDCLTLLRKAGRLDAGLAPLLAAQPPPGATGIGHTRWATHGPPTDADSHPHLDRAGRVAAVHNGVIENYDILRRAPAARGHAFRSDTDTEVPAHLVGEAYGRTRGGLAGDQHPLAAAVAEALRQVIGTYGIAVVAADAPDVIVAARRGSPLIIGMGEDEHFVASDAGALVAHTRDAVYLHDFDLATVRAGGVDIRRLEGEAAAREVRRIELDATVADRGGFPHFMLKEIHAQPQTARHVLRGRLDREELTARFGGLNLSAAELRAVDRVVIVACGTSWHAGLLGEYVIEELAGIPVEVEYASEFPYRNAPLDKHILVLTITQSGETADTLAGLREARRRGHTALALCSVVGSTIAREADGGIYLHAGPEIGVASLDQGLHRAGRDAHAARSASRAAAQPAADARPRTHPRTRGAAAAVRGGAR
ncbi:MAG: glutamine--fructose-6-phosphate transaminase (isomerizing), partial [Limisphaerales bacterium]